MADNSETRKERRTAARAERAARERAAAARARQRKRLWQLGGLAGIVVVIVAVIVIATSGGSSSDGKPTLQVGESVPGQKAAAALFAGIPQSGLTLGKPDAPYTMEEFADLQCIYCKQYTNTSQATVIDRYVRTGKLKIVFRNLTIIGTDSLRAAQMAGEVAKQDKLWQYADIFYANQGQENSGYVTDDFLRKIGGGVAGLDVTKAMNDRGSADVQKQLTQAEQLATQYGVNGTPSFVIGRTGGTLKLVQVTGLDPASITKAFDAVIK